MDSNNRLDLKKIIKAKNLLLSFLGNNLCHNMEYNSSIRHDDLYYDMLSLDKIMRTKKANIDEYFICGTINSAWVQLQHSANDKNVIEDHGVFANIATALRKLVKLKLNESVTEQIDAKKLEIYHLLQQENTDPTVVTEQLTQLLNEICALFNKELNGTKTIKAIVYTPQQTTFKEQSQLFELLSESINSDRNVYLDFNHCDQASTILFAITLLTAKNFKRAINIKAIFYHKWVHNKKNNLRLQQIYVILERLKHAEQTLSSQELETLQQQIMPIVQKAKSLAPKKPTIVINSDIVYHSGYAASALVSDQLNFYHTTGKQFYLMNALIIYLKTLASPRFIAECSKWQKRISYPHLCEMLGLVYPFYIIEIKKLYPDLMTALVKNHECDHVIGQLLYDALEESNQSWQSEDYDEITPFAHRFMKHYIKAHEVVRSLLIFNNYYKCLYECKLFEKDLESTYQDLQAENPELASAYVTLRTIYDKYLLQKDTSAIPPTEITELMKGEKVLNAMKLQATNFGLKLDEDEVQYTTTSVLLSFLGNSADPYVDYSFKNNQEFAHIDLSSAESSIPMAKLINVIDDTVDQLIIVGSATSAWDVFFDTLLHHYRVTLKSDHKVSEQIDDDLLPIQQYFTSVWEQQGSLDENNIKQLNDLLAQCESFEDDIGEHITLILLPQKDIGREVTPLIKYIIDKIVHSTEPHMKYDLYLDATNCDVEEFISLYPKLQAYQESQKLTIKNVFYSSFTLPSFEKKNAVFGDLQNTLLNVQKDTDFKMCTDSLLALVDTQQASTEHKEHTPDTNGLIIDFESMLQFQRSSQDVNHFLQSKDIVHLLPTTSLDEEDEELKTNIQAITNLEKLNLYSYCSELYAKVRRQFATWANLNQAKGNDKSDLARIKALLSKHIFAPFNNFDQNPISLYFLKIEHFMIHERDAIVTIFCATQASDIIYDQCIVAALHYKDTRLFNLLKEYNDVATRMTQLGVTDINTQNPQIQALSEKYLKCHLEFDDKFYLTLQEILHQLTTVQIGKYIPQILNEVITEEDMSMVEDDLNNVMQALTVFAAIWTFSLRPE